MEKIFEDKEFHGNVKFFQGNEFKQGVGGVKVLALLVSQTSTAIPTSKEIRNEFDGITYIWSRSAAGKYTLTASDDIFTEDMTIVLFGTVTNAITGFVEFSAQWASASTITIWTTDNAGTSADGAMLDISLKIEVYT